MTDAQVTEEQVYAALSKVMDPELDHSVVELGLIQDVDIDEGTVTLDVQLTSPHCPFAKEIIHSIKKLLLILFRSILPHMYQISQIRNLPSHSLIFLL